MNTVAPLLTGTTWRTYTLAVTLGTWQGAGNIYSYQWQRCDPATTQAACAPGDASWTPINGQTATSYTLTQADEGDLVRALVTASNPDGTATAPSNTTTAVISPYPPQNTVPPVITGTPQRTFTLAASTGTWTGPNVLISYQWQRYTAATRRLGNISGATASSYALTQADEGTVVRVVVSGTNVDGTVQEASAQTALITGLAPQNQTAPVITGSAQRGCTLAASQGSWQGLGNTYTYQWQRSADNGTTWTDIQGANTTAYPLTKADEGTQVRITVTATNPDGSMAASSTPTASILSAPPLNTADPVLTGTPQRGSVLTATAGTWSGLANAYTYQWQRSADGTTWTSIPGATGLATPFRWPTRTTRSGCSSPPPTWTDRESPPVERTVAAAPPAKTTAPTIAGNAQRGHALTSPPGVRRHRQQLRLPVAALHRRHHLDGHQRRHRHHLHARGGRRGRDGARAQTATNADGTANRASAPTAAIPVSAPVNTVAPAVTGTASAARLLTATPGTWSGTATPTPTSGSPRPTARLDELEGETGTGYTLTAADVGTQLRVKVTATNPDGTVHRREHAGATVQAAPPSATTAPVLTGRARASTLNGSQGSGPARQHLRLPVAALRRQRHDLDGHQGRHPELLHPDRRRRASIVRLHGHRRQPGRARRRGGLQLPTATVSGAPPTNTVAPAVSGTAQRASTLTATQGTWGGIGNTYTYQWQRRRRVGLDEHLRRDLHRLHARRRRRGRDRPGAPHRLPTPTAASPSRATRPRRSPPRRRPTAPPPTASGTAQRTYTLSATAGTWAGIGNTYTYQWQRSIDGTTWADILAATSLTYTLTQADEGNYVRFQVTAVNPDGVLTVQSSTTAKVTGAPPVNSVAPALSGQAARGATLTTGTGTWSGLGNTYTYQWQSSADNGTTWTSILGASRATYTPGLTDERHLLRAHVSATNADGSASADSTATAAVAATPPQSTTAPTLTGQAARAQVLTANPGVWSAPITPTPTPGSAPPTAAPPGRRSAARAPPPTRSPRPTRALSSASPSPRRIPTSRAATPPPAGRPSRSPPLRR